MLRIGLTGFGLSAACALLLTLLSAVGFAHFGPCGPDLVGLVLFPGFFIFGGFGLLLSLAGVLKLGLQKLRHRID